MSSWLSLTDTEAPVQLRHSCRKAKCISDTLESEPSAVVLLGGLIEFQDICKVIISFIK